MVLNDELKSLSSVPPPLYYLTLFLSPQFWQVFLRGPPVMPNICVKRVTSSLWCSVASACTLWRNVKKFGILPHSLFMFCFVLTINTILFLENINRPLYSFFWVTLRRLNFISRRFGTLCVSKRRLIKFRRRGIPQKKAYNIQHTAKVWNQELTDRLTYGLEICLQTT